MTTIKTAISIDDLLFQRAEALAAELHVSRSRLFVLAMEEYIQRRQNQRLLASHKRSLWRRHRTRKSLPSASDAGINIGE